MCIHSSSNIIQKQVELSVDRFQACLLACFHPWFDHDHAYVKHFHHPVIKTILQTSFYFTVVDQILLSMPRTQRNDGRREAFDSILQHRVRPLSLFLMLSLEACFYHVNYITKGNRWLQSIAGLFTGRPVRRSKEISDCARINASRRRLVQSAAR